MEGKSTRARINLAELELNIGQIPGLPANPRQWTEKDVREMSASIKETPELLEMRCPIVVPHEGKYVVIARNLGVTAARKIGMTDIECIIYEGAGTQKLKEIAAKDNVHFGHWDFDALANSWDDLPLADWGVDISREWQQAAEAAEEDITPDDLGDTFELAKGDKKDFQQISFVFSDEQADAVRDAVRKVIKENPEECAFSDGNSNKSGNALYKIIREWDAQKR